MTGDEAANASIAVAGQSLTGELDYLFDFDYFRFQAGQGLWLHVEVLIETPETLSVGLYEADGATLAHMRIEDIGTILSNSGRFIDVGDLKHAAWVRSVSFDWISPPAEEFLLRVSGANGSVGTYTVTSLCLNADA